MSKSNSDELRGTKVDWSTPYDDWLIPILNRYRRGGAIECRAIPSEIQLLIEAEYSKRELEARIDELTSLQHYGSPTQSFVKYSEIEQRLRQLTNKEIT